MLEDFCQDLDGENVKLKIIEENTINFIAANEE